LPEGEYLGEINGEITEAISQFDKAKTFLRIPMLLKSSVGDYRSFTWTVGPGTALYGEFIKVLGGKQLPNGVVEPPKSFFKKPLIIELKQVDNKRHPGQAVNQVVNVRRWEKSSPFGSAADEPPAPSDDEEPDVPEGPLEDAPF
jgi:hypothetical protein